METIPIFLTLLAIATCRTVPDTNYIPPKEQLEMIFRPVPGTDYVPPKEQQEMIFRPEPDTNYVPPKEQLEMIFRPVPDTNYIPPKEQLEMIFRPVPDTNYIPPKEQLEMIFRPVPDTNYIPPKEQLEMIFRPDTYIKAVETPAFVANKSVIKEERIKPYQKKISNAIRESGPNTMELNINIKVDCDQKGPDKSEGEKNVKQSPGKCDPEVNTRFAEDLSVIDIRVTFDADDCPKHFVRFAGVCVGQDT